MKAPLRHIFCLVTLLAGSVGFADTVITRDGITRVGTIESRDEREVRLRMNNDGISSVIVIPMPQVSRIILGGPGTTSAPASAPATKPTLDKAPPPTTSLSTEKPTPMAPLPLIKPPTEPEMANYSSRGFIFELAASAVGRGLDDVDRLPAELHELWDRAMMANAMGRPSETLDTLRRLEAAAHQLPGGIQRLDAITRRNRNEGFGTWLGRAHWELISASYANGQFDLTDIRDIERPVLIGMMKGKMSSALEPLKTYFPPIDEKTGQATAFKPAQLAGLTMANAMEVKEQSLLAAAVILGQLKLEPDMPGIDRSFLSVQLANVNRVLSRARDLEPQARAAALRAEQEKRIAEEKARRDAAINARKAAMSPR